MSRHGDRTPTFFLPNEFETTWNCPPEESIISQRNMNHYIFHYGDNCQSRYCGLNPLKNHKWNGNCTMGQLTEKGMNQLKKLGVILREIYINP